MTRIDDQYHRQAAEVFPSTTATAVLRLKQSRKYLVDTLSRLAAEGAESERLYLRQHWFAGGSVSIDAEREKEPGALWSVYARCEQHRCRVEHKDLGEAVKLALDVLEAEMGD